jgi:hypothetical protein
MACHLPHTTMARLNHTPFAVLPRSSWRRSRCACPPRPSSTS